MKRVRIIGGGLAGSEAAWQLAQRGIPVVLHEMKPKTFSPAHKTPALGELVCSNSLRSDALTNGVGLLKAELRRLGSLVIAAADATRVPAGGALAVDREAFSAWITQRIEAHPRIEVIREEVVEIPEERPTLIATGPLTSPALSEAIRARTGQDACYFYDAIAPIVEGETIDFSVAFWASRYGKGGDDYVNCPMDRETYVAFVEAVRAGEKVPPHTFEEEKFFHGCMPIEVMAERGLETLAHGPMKPVGLIDPRTGKRPYAVVQLRQDDVAATLFNIVGFQTKLKWGEQKRIFRMIPGLERAEFCRFGSLHRNTFINAPRLLDPWLQLRSDPGIFFAGQITGVEG
ncbi:MAG: methylenetetrahydrofolate--tRNA-(uracil(54)-C(5))-methyltransferase (FADH(2)-oxidizing) TrmFO, partial [Deltaproteobacteria bacterium]